MEVHTIEGKNGKVRFYHTDKHFWQCRKCGNVGGKLGFTKLVPQNALLSVPIAMNVHSKNR